MSIMLDIVSVGSFKEQVDIDYCLLFLHIIFGGQDASKFTERSRNRVAKSNVLTSSWLCHCDAYLDVTMQIEK